MGKKIFKGIWSVLKVVVNFIGMVTIYMLFMSLMWGKGELKWHVPFTEDHKVWVWDNTGGNK